MITSTTAEESSTCPETLEQETRRLREGYKSLTQQLIGLRLVQEITQDLVSERDVARLLKRILCSAIHAVHGAAGALLLLDPSGEELIFSVVEGGGGTALEGQRMGRHQGLAGWVVTHNEPLIIANVHEDDRFYGDIPAKVDYEVTSLICAPLLVKGEAIGVVQVLNRLDGGQFDGDDLSLLTSFAAQSAITIENTRLYQNLKRERDRLIAVEEEVRKNLARDLHDGPAQLLAALITCIGFIDKLQEQEPEKVPDELEILLPLAQKALRQVRTLLFDLRPVILETQGLVPALRSYIKRQQEIDEISYHLRVDSFSGRLNAQAERSIFSIVQEAIGNIKKHAQAQHVWINVVERDDELLIGVRDDGKGFSVDWLVAEYDGQGSLGMLTMRERAEAIGGFLSIQSLPGAGTTILVQAPLSLLRDGAEETNSQFDT
ncbi:MAG TPA: GAF domain-containing sensor histidine kinase [Anaerolineae bacterium]|nr:GAF domain-containing sensor histidine kinase [Anaerolineae bacterium]